MTQGSVILNIFERICRSNIYLFLISRFIIGKYFSKIIYDTDFKIFKILEKNGYFNRKKPIIDIGANDGMSYYAIRKFVRNTKIISFEPNSLNFKFLQKIKLKDSLFELKKIALSDKKGEKIFYTPFFKKYALSQIAGISKPGVLDRLRNSLYVKNLSKKIILKKQKIKTINLDFFKYNPSFIKIDIEGHEFECIKGSLQTIIKNKPIIMVEYNRIICNKIDLILKKQKYKKYFNNKFNKKIEIFKNQKIFNIFFIQDKFLKFIT